MFIFRFYALLPVEEEESSYKIGVSGQAKEKDAQNIHERQEI